MTSGPYTSTKDTERDSLKSPDSKRLYTVFVSSCSGELIVAYIVCDFHIFILLFVVFLLCLLCSYVFFKGLLVRYLVHFELILVCGVSSFACTSPVFPGALAESSYFAFFVECF